MAVHLWTHFASAGWRCQTPWLRRCGVARGRLVLSPLCNRLRNSQDGGHSSGLLIEVCFRKQNQCPKNEGHQRHIVPLEKGAGDAVFDSREIHYLLPSPKHGYGNRIVRAMAGCVSIKAWEI